MTAAPAAVAIGHLHPRRSCLAVPGGSPRFLEKAPGLPADQVFLDLEDACAPLVKESGRHAGALGHIPVNVVEHGQDIFAAIGKYDRPLQDHWPAASAISQGSRAGARSSSPPKAAITSTSTSPSSP